MHWKRDHPTVTEMTAGITCAGPEAYPATADGGKKGTAAPMELRSDPGITTETTDGNASKDLNARPESLKTRDLGIDTTGTAGGATLSKEHPADTELTTRTPLYDPTPNVDTSAIYESGRPYGRITTPVETATNPPTLPTGTPQDAREMATGNTSTDLDSCPDVYTTQDQDQCTKGTADPDRARIEFRTSVCTTGEVHIGTETHEVWETIAGTTLTDLQHESETQRKTTNDHRDSRGTADLAKVGRESRTRVGITTRTTPRGTDPNPGNRATPPPDKDITCTADRKRNVTDHLTDKEIAVGFPLTNPDDHGKHSDYSTTNTLR
ncbi:MAG: hypothetical protein KVP17_004117 [Porospora cf. gigantea B]|uniref:uncharacterized protein n=1 Tax=Porospora cf. gigantea B TaxID=2853592 RepID=UPI003571BDF4|nr:MAG: hypothetical protein KVP17_004117 [Porospora cf. gigantea B]